ncbi:MAG TPA: alpha/beta hydrolase [Gemmatimonadaceae bacterium]
MIRRKSDDMNSRGPAHDTASLRLLVAVLLFLASLLAVMPAQTYDLWKASIAGAELGHFVAIAAALTLLIPGWWRSVLGQLAGGITVVAIGLALSPLVRAYAATRELDRSMDAAFGPVPADSSSQPIVLSQLIKWPELSGVTVRTLHYAVRDNKPLELDLYRVGDTTVARPLVVTIHGGSWAGGERTDLPSLNYYLARRGYTVAALNYRLAPDHPFPAATQDVNDAVSYLESHARQLGIDPTKIVLLGRSAGGQLALQSAYTTSDSSIKGVVALYAPTDQQWGWEHPANVRVYDSYSVLRRFLNGEPSQVPDAYRQASPINYIGSHTIPTLLIHGAMDPLVSVRQSARLDSALAAAGRPHYFLELPWATHGCDYVFNGPCGQASTFAIDRFLKATLR